jgi:polysaccharide export outer membrane protein
MGRIRPRRTFAHIRAPIGVLPALVLLLPFAGCWAPLVSHGVPARSLSDNFRIPHRTGGRPLNYSQLTTSPPPDYLLGPQDVLEVTVPGLFERTVVHSIPVRVMANGEVYLPMVGAVPVGGMNLVGAQAAIERAYANGFLHEPRVTVSLLEKSTVTVLVLGKVKQPGMHELPKYQNDVGHAVAAAQGLAEDAADVIEVHRRSALPEPLPGQVARLPAPSGHTHFPGPGGPGQFDCLCETDAPGSVQTIPLRGPHVAALGPEDVRLQSGDVVVVPSRRHEVFYVVGKLNQTNTVRFTVGDRDRELGAGFVLPRDREIDVVTAVAMAGYIDPIDSPTTVTVHRVMPDGSPLLVHVDLIAARYDPKETILVAPGDIIYLNPDAHWWMRRTFDRVVGRMLTLPYEFYLFR